MLRVGLALSRSLRQRVRKDFAFSRPLTAVAMTELLGKTLADGGFHLPKAVAPVESLSR